YQAIRKYCHGVLSFPSTLFIVLQDQQVRVQHITICTISPHTHTISHTHDPLSTYVGITTPPTQESQPTLPHPSHTSTLNLNHTPQIIPHRKHHTKLWGQPVQRTSRRTSCHCGNLRIITPRITNYEGSLSFSEPSIFFIKYVSCIQP
ncbi:hypothetical protein LOAG_10659, partial [Loa loa]